MRIGHKKHELHLSKFVEWSEACMLRYTTKTPHNPLTPPSSLFIAKFQKTSNFVKLKALMSTGSITTTWYISELHLRKNSNYSEAYMRRYEGKTSMSAQRTPFLPLPRVSVKYRPLRAIIVLSMFWWLNGSVFTISKQEIFFYVICNCFWPKIHPGCVASWFVVEFPSRRRQGFGNCWSIRAIMDFYALHLMYLPKFDFIE